MVRLSKAGGYSLYVGGFNGLNSTKYRVPSQAGRQSLFGVFFRFFLSLDYIPVVWCTVLRQVGSHCMECFYGLHATSMVSHFKAGMYSHCMECFHGLHCIPSPPPAPLPLHTTVPKQEDSHCMECFYGPHCTDRKSVGSYCKECFVES